jgi:hypothetical protein
MTTYIAHGISVRPDPFTGLAASITNNVTLEFVAPDNGDTFSYISLGEQLPDPAYCKTSDRGQDNKAQIHKGIISLVMTSAEEINK